jgi:hypothetical protein
MSKYTKELESFFPVKMIESEDLPKVDGYKFFKTKGDNPLFEIGECDTKKNLQQTINHLITEIKDNEVILKNLKVESGKFMDKDEFMYYFNNSVSFIIYQIYGINITNLHVLPHTELTANQFYTTVLKNRDKYIKELKLVINNIKKSDPASVCFMKSNVRSPYRLHANYSSDINIEQMFIEFTTECQKFMLLPSSNNTNLYNFYRGESVFTRLIFELSESCIKKFFVTLHSKMKISTYRIIKCPTQIDNKFLSNLTVLLHKQPKTNDYTPLNYKNFGKADETKCTSGHSNDISVAISKLN